MTQEISSFSFTISSQDHTNEIIADCQTLIEEIYEDIAHSNITIKLTGLSSMFEKLKDNVEKQRS